MRIQELQIHSIWFHAAKLSRHAARVVTLALLVSAGMTSWESHAADLIESCRRANYSEILKGQTKLKNNRFIADRSFGDYKVAFRNQSGIASLLEQLRQLPEGALVMDSGAGYARALRSILADHKALHLPKLRGLAVSYKKPDHDLVENKWLAVDLLQLSDRLTYIDGTYIEKMIHVQLIPYKGQVDLLMEVWGPLVYTVEFTAVLNAYADLLKVGGRALIHFQENRTNIFLADSQGRLTSRSFRDMAAEIPVLTGGRLIMKASGPRVDDMGESHPAESVVWLEKVADGEAPVNLREQITHFSDAAPPHRTFLIRP